MKKKCPSGVICIENFTMTFIGLFIILAAFFIYSNLNKERKSGNHQGHSLDSRSMGLEVITQIPNYPYNNIFMPPPVPGDVLLNPYAPPLRDERYLIPQVNFIPAGAVPINVSTNVGSVDTSYRQVGILNPTNKPNKDNVLPLMGRPVFTNRDKWQYYTIGNQHNNIKLPVVVKGKSGLNEYGVDRIYNGDTVYIEGLNDVYRVTIYDNDTIKYLPFI